MHSIRISVIIPVFNVEPYLAEALDSVVRQTYGDLEVIIVDDGSTDGSGAICDEYAARDRRITVVHQGNRGLSSARNAGLDLATGEAVAFLDPDDAFRPDFIQTMTDAMIRERADIVVCWYTIQTTVGPLDCGVSDERRPRIAGGRYGRAGALRAIADGSLNVNVWNKLYRRALWEHVRFPDGRVYESAYASLGVFDGCDSVFVLESALYTYRKRPGSITDIESPRNARDRLLAHSHMVSFMEGHTPGVFTPEQVERRRRSLLNEMVVSYARFSGDKSDEAREFTRSLREAIDAELEGGAAGIEGCWPKTIAACWMIRKCPWLLTALYPPYNDARLLLRRVSGHRG